MRKSRLSDKEKMEILVGRAVLTLLGGIIGAGLVLGFVFLLGIFEQFLETHTWAFVTFILIDLILLFREISK